MDLKEVKAFFEENKDNEDVQSFVKELNPLNLERIKGFVGENEDGKKWLQSETDNKVTKAIETFKERTLPGLVDAEKEKIRAELNPKETDEQKKIRELTESQNKLQKELRFKELLNNAKDYMTEKGLPASLTKYFIGEDEDSTIRNIDLLAGEYSKAVNTKVEAAFKGNGRDPHKTKDNDGTYFTFDEISRMSQAEIMANKEKVDKSLERMN